MQVIGIIKATIDELKNDGFKQSVDSVLNEYVAAKNKTAAFQNENKKALEYIAEKKLQEGR